MEILVLNGPMRGIRFPLVPGENTVGRAGNNEVQIDDPAAAWRHCRLVVTAEGCEIHDLRAPGGTRVNGEKVQRSRVGAGDTIALGETLLRLRESSPFEEEGALGPASALLAASTLLYAFRALPASGPASQCRRRQQIARLVMDLLPSSEVETYLVGQDADPVLPQSLVQRLLGGDSLLGDEGWVGMPLHVFGKVGGYIALRLHPSQVANILVYQQTLAAVASIGSAALENSRELERARLQNELLKERLSPTSGIVGESAAVRRLRSVISRVAPRETTVLILGESGTGKELVARAIHDQSMRKQAPFVAINCAAITETLLESELFGHEKGAFTGASALKRGKLEMAEGGSVFLDEIGELAAPLQAKLLRVLQQRELERVGSTRTLPLDVRIVAATNRDLAAAVKRGEFREDLYHRLNVVNIRTPPLRERRDDIMLLAGHFLALASSRHRRNVTGFSAEAQSLLIAYDWPGNVRELENAVERAVVLGAGEIVEAEDLVLDADTEPKGSFQDSMVDAKRDSILRAYQQARGDYKEAAGILGLHPNYLLRLVRKLGLKQLVKETSKR